MQGLPQVFLFRIHYLKEVLLIPALKNRDEKVIGGLASLLAETGQAVCIKIMALNETNFIGFSVSFLSNYLKVICVTGTFIDC